MRRAKYAAVHVGGLPSGIWLRATLLLPLAIFSIGAEKPRNPCCFRNDNYVGVCIVQPGPNETCKSILAYLNKPNSAGKTYCMNTVIRRRWKKTTCPASKTKPES